VVEQDQRKVGCAMTGQTRNVDFYLDVPDPPYPGCYACLTAHSDPEFLDSLEPGLRRYRIIVPLPHDNPIDEIICVERSQVEMVK